MTEPVQKDEIQSVVLAFSVLELLARSDNSKGVTEISAQLDIPKARVFRHLRTLLRLGYVEQDPESEKYYASMKLFLIGREIGNRVSLLAAARPTMQWLRDELGHSVTISIVVSHSIRVLDMIRGSSPFEIGTKPGSEFALHATAQGKLALAFGPAQLRDDYLKRRLDTFTPHTIVDKADLRRVVSEAKECGWAAAPEEILLGINALAAPIFDSSGDLAGTIAVVDSIQNLPARPERRQIERVLEAVEKISRTLGHEPQGDS